MQVHAFIALMSSVVLHETGSTTLDLNAASCLLLDVFDVRTTLTDNLSTKVESGDGLEIHRNLLFRPFALNVLVRQTSKHNFNTDKNSRDPWNLFRLVLVLCDGSVFRLQG